MEVLFYGIGGNRLKVSTAYLLNSLIGYVGMPEAQNLNTSPHDIRNERRIAESLLTD